MSSMDGMDGMSGTGGMDMAGTSLFLADNMKVAHVLWYIVAAVAGIRGSRTLIEYSRTLFAKRRHTTRSAVPSRPTTLLAQGYDTLLATFRESSYPALHPFRGRITQFFTPPPLGQCFLILTYWMVILIMLFTNVFLGPSSSLYGYRWEKPAFRAAWISVTQLPLVYALSCKFNVISIITGISYERLNWMHRWVSRTLFLTVIVHWAYFFHEWTLADFVKVQFQMMPMVKYGFGAWAVIGWTVLTGFGLFRDLCYELWVLQHLASAGVLLWLVYVHVPSYARYNVWLAIGFVAFDRVARGIWSVITNLHLRAFGKGGIGYSSEVSAYAPGYIKLTVKNVDFRWRAGQHVFMSIPTCGIFESHPFTISNTYTPANLTSQDLDVFLKCHSGFTRKLQSKAQRAQAQGKSLSIHHIFLSGPWGIPPMAAIERSNSLIFVASSTGASYTVPLLEHAIQKARFVQRVSFYWIVRHASQVSWFDARMKAAVERLVALGVKEIQFRVYITGVDAETECKTLSLPADSVSEVRQTGASQPPQDEKCLHEKQGPDVAEVSDLSSSSSSSIVESPSNHDCPSPFTPESASQMPSIVFTAGRPHSFDSLIRPTIEAAEGETVVVACGGRAMMAQIRTYVASLSDERAVHKGTGAQGIYLWTESYGW